MLLCVDSDAASREATAETLRDAGFAVAEAATAGAARERFDDDLEGLVTEQSLPDGTGLELVADVREAVPDTPCVLFTDVPIAEIDTAAFGDLVVEYVPKDAPEARSEVVDLLNHAVAFRSQTAYPLPENEDARLAALEQYAANPDDLGASFDRLTELAAELFGVKAAAVGLIDTHEQRFLACTGVSFEPMDREDTICTYAILDGDVTVIEDVLDDRRFRDNEGLQAVDIRFYASAPVETPSGEAIGTFCVYDDEPREFSARDRELLSLLGDEAMEQLTLRRRLREVADE
ncbi:putative periplasmic ligand-binding sensor domain protein [Halolamina pelagica]|uniref:Putative periplasmic ligand-binding sensor domain protein n=1 Tax=Halolamina pelagica TaxID=699431 RepID=A0A0P7H1H0_9EURY|nr:GAF domain-containing protein [Halolamina pelagica]KPN32244.1 putative periplasmic ligand-binding sensor domain protein [Halolamina pelagica]